MQTGRTGAIRECLDGFNYEEMQKMRLWMLQHYQLLGKRWMRFTEFTFDWTWNQIWIWWGKIPTHIWTLCGPSSKMKFTLGLWAICDATTLKYLNSCADLTFGCCLLFRVYMWNNLTLKMVSNAIDCNSHIILNPFITVFQQYSASHTLRK